MHDNLQNILLEALTNALELNTAVTIKNSQNNGMIVITATSGEIILSISKQPLIFEDCILVISDALEVRPDLIYDRMSLLGGDFRVYYCVWFRDTKICETFLNREYAMDCNNFKYLSDKAKALIQNIN